MAALNAHASHRVARTPIASNVTNVPISAPSTAPSAFAP